MKRVTDVLLSILGLTLASPILVPVMCGVYLQDRLSPFYIAPRVGRCGKLFRIVKLRSMRVNADKTGVDSTGAADPRITSIGRFIRRYKLDEVTQLWNVLIGDMSLVGPRPNVERETRLYTAEEQRLLTVKPGITDFASIVFSDEGEILKDKADPDIAYNQLIRPWKSRLGLIYVDQLSLSLDLKLIVWTGVAILSRRRALNAVVDELVKRGVDEAIVRVSRRADSLVPTPPPGTDKIATARC